MANQVIIDYLKQHSGEHKLGDLKKKIISTGYNEDEVDEAIKQLGLDEKQDTETKEIDHKISVGVKIISIFYFVVALIFIFLLIGLFFLIEIVSSLLDLGILIRIGLIITVGIFLFVSAIFNFFIGIGLWKGKNWARILAIIFAIIIIVYSLFNLNFLNISFSIINLIIVVYLFFNKKAKAVFSK